FRPGKLLKGSIVEAVSGVDANLVDLRGLVEAKGQGLRQGIGAGAAPAGNLPRVEEIQRLVQSWTGILLVVVGGLRVTDGRCSERGKWKRRQRKDTTENPHHVHGGATIIYGKGRRPENGSQMPALAAAVYTYRMSRK